MALKVLKRPDEDPLEVGPHERFERATMTPDGLRTYRQLLYEKPDPNQPPLPVQLYNRGTRLPPRQREMAVQEAIYAISWTYNMPRAVVEHDLLEAMKWALRERLRTALTDGSMVPIDSQIAQEAIEAARNP